MSVKARLSLAVVVLLGAATAVVGWVVVDRTRESMIASVDDSLLEFAPRADLLHGRREERGPAFRQFAELALLPGRDGWIGFASGFEDDPQALPDIPLPSEPAFDELRRQPGTVRAVDGSVDYRVVIFDRPAADVAVAVAAPLDDVERTVDDLLLTVVVTGAIVVALGAAGSWWVVRRSLRPVDRMIDTAAAIAGGDLSQRVEHRDDGTELGRLAGALDDMLGQLEAAWQEREASQARLRQFVADASHELRTPVAAIRGYAELYRQGGLPPGEALERAMHRIETEGLRVGRLVEDLLLLARFDQHGPLAAAPVDLSQVARDAVAGFDVIDNLHPIDVQADDGVMVSGDELRLRQVVDNLVGNAIAHTPAGTPVSVAVSREDGSAVVVVADVGPGVPLAERERVFERFHRVDPSRSRHTGGTGLGLAIVAAVAKAHGGTVTLDEPEGGGARFTVRLPIA
ncbi:MAG: sensor histidine kinase [Acidimicrobiales bacterium]